MKITLIRELNDKTYHVAIPDHDLFKIVTGEKQAHFPKRQFGEIVSKLVKFGIRIEYAIYNKLS